MCPRRATIRRRGGGGTAFLVDDVWMARRPRRPLPFAFGVWTSLDITSDTIPTSRSIRNRGGRQVGRRRISRRPAVVFATDFPMGWCSRGPARKGAKVCAGKQPFERSGWRRRARPARPSNLRLKITRFSLSFLHAAAPLPRVFRHGPPPFGRPPMSHRSWTPPEHAGRHGDVARAKQSVLEGLDPVPVRHFHHFPRSISPTRLCPALSLYVPCSQDLGR